MAGLDGRLARLEGRDHAPDRPWCTCRPPFAYDDIVAELDAADLPAEAQIERQRCPACGLLPEIVVVYSTWPPAERPFSTKEE